VAAKPFRDVIESFGIAMENRTWHNRYGDHPSCSDVASGDREGDVAVGRAQDLAEPEPRIRATGYGSGIAVALDRSGEVAAICRSSVSRSDT
jgi:hypothetical protein